MHFDNLEGWLRWQETLHPTTIDLGLERAAEVFAALNPKSVKPPTITVAGTNGKGSCIAYLDSIYRTQGYRVGTYTSPHILKYNERIKIDGQPVSDDIICAAFERIESVRRGISLSYFEFGTLAALDIFWRSGLDVQLLEVGMGGRLDAVNIVDPDTCIISSIGVDHVQWLGNDRESIGREKAGIMRRQTPAVVGEPNPPASLLKTAKDINALLFLFGQDFGYTLNENTWEWHGGKSAITRLPYPPLKGGHQLRNAASAILAIDQMTALLPVDEAAIRSGLQQTRLTGRFQLLNWSGKAPLLLDVGHNPEAVATLAAHLQTDYPGKRIQAVFTMMKDKDIAGVLNIMKPFIQHWHYVPIANNRAPSLAAMREIFLQSGIVNVSFDHHTINDALAAAQSQTQADDLILVFGSFFLVSDCLNHFTGEMTQ